MQIYITKHVNRPTVGDGHYVHARHMIYTIQSYSVMYITIQCWRIHNYPNTNGSCCLPANAASTCKCWLAHKRNGLVTNSGWTPVWLEYQSPEGQNIEFRMAKPDLKNIVFAEGWVGSLSFEKSLTTNGSILGSHFFDISFYKMYCGPQPPPAPPKKAHFRRSRGPT